VLPHPAATSSAAGAASPAEVVLIVGRTEGPPPDEIADVHVVTAAGVPVRPTESIAASSSCGLGAVPVFRLGDLDGDGLGELGVASAAGSEAFVTIVHGHAAGAAARTTRIDSPVRGAASCFGHSMISADVDRDGDLDLIVGAPMTDGERGSVLVYLAADRALSVTSSETILGPRAAGRFGTSVAACDRGGDSMVDLFVGATEEDELRGAVYVLERRDGAFAAPRRRATRPGASPSDRFGSRLAAAGTTCTVLAGWNGGVTELDASGAPTAFSVAGSAAPFALGDVTGDGVPEAIVCDGRAIRVHARGAAGLDAAPLSSIPLAPNDACSDLAVPGDLDRDGRADVVVGIRGYAGRPAEARLFYGAASGLGTAPSVLRAPTGAGSIAFAHWVR
jgi:hypothetical protein